MKVIISKIKTKAIMKKYLMTSVAALALCAGFTSCSHDDFEPYSQSELIQKNYEAAFVRAFGQPASSQTWGFGQALSTRANPGTDVYPATHEYKDADGNVIAGANMNHNQWADPNEGFGGWLVPDPLTEGQKLRVQRYFQTHPYLGYDDPHFRHFFVQQVYKGGSDQQGVSKENIVAADNSTYTSGNMNLLTVGVANSHINDFNAGSCSPSDVLQNDGTTKSDQITLMVNVYDTSCFGYHETGSSTHHNDKMALASAAVIDAWADSLQNATGETIGEAVVDKWNRSFMGFDLAIKEGAQAYATDNAGNVLYATYDQAAESPKVAWDGEKMINIADPTKYYPIEYYDEYKTIMGCGWLTTNQNFYVAKSKVKMSQTISMNRAQASTITTIQDAPVLKDVMVGDTYYQSVINLPRIKQLVDEGYLPVKDKSLTEWVKVGKSDAYYSDWIVTLTEAKRIPDEIVPEDYDIRVIAEDLSAGAEKSDFDFNDVVFDVKFDASNAKVKILAAGGTLPLCLGLNGTPNEEWEVHKLFKVDTNYMVNTNAQSKGLNGNNKDADKYVELPLAIGVADAAEANSKINVYVKKNGEWVELTAQQGKAASKVAVGTDYDWCDEREDVDAKYFGADDARFTKYVGGQYTWNTWYKE
jgi:hypothetical protein